MIDTLSLYHGTDTSAARLILEEGMPQDYHKGMGVRAFARELAKVIVDALGIVDKEGWEIDFTLNSIRPGSADVAAWNLWVKSLPSLLEISSGTDFNYGPLYVTPSFARARSYCADNPYRSEFLRSVVGGLEIARAIGEGEARRAEDILDQHPACRAAIEAPGDPVVIEFRGISPEALKTETGNADLSNEIKLLDILNEVGADPQLSFRVERFDRRQVVKVYDLKAQLSDQACVANATQFGVPAEVWLALLARKTR